MAGEDTIGRDDNGAGVKERILRAAVDEFAITGFHLTSLRTIAERSGSNKPMIYYHFHGKEGLYLAAVRLLLEEMADALRTAIERPGSATDRLRRFAEVYLDAFIVSRPMLGMALRELNSLSQPLYSAIVDEYNRLVSPQLRRVLADGVEHGEFRGMDLGDCAGGIVNLLHGYVRLRHVATHHALRVALSQLMDFYVVGMLSPEALRAHLRTTQPYAAGVD